MTRAGVAGARFRQRKLSTKQTLQVLREDQVEKIDDDPQRHVPKVETGVEKTEETEHHLQAAISASQAAAVGGKVAQIYIPTPDTVVSSLQYERLYSLRFSQPATYIRFSSTVEDCNGHAYCMTAEDDAFLSSVNEKKSASALCNEDRFEEVMTFFEQTAQSKQPFAMVDNAPVLTYDEMESFFDETISESARSFAKDIYPHWKSQRLRRGNKTLMPSLKFETGAETDDSDPYVCFRRREVRQVRKTRGRDAQSSEKLKRLRKELEDARQLVAMVKQREIMRRDILAVDRQLFEQRAKVKDAKRSLGIKGDDEDLVNQKPQKKKTSEATPMQRPASTQLRLSARPDGRSSELDLVLLSDVLTEKENEIQKEIDTKIIQHQRWNEGYIDLTRRPLTPPPEPNVDSGFRTAITEFLPTPPSSVSSEVMDLDGDDGIHDSGREGLVTFRYASPSLDGYCQSRPSFRRRVGRGGRLMIDRRGMRLQSTEAIDERIVDKFKYDHDDEDEEPTYAVDPYDTLNMRYRASIIGNSREQAAHQAAQIQAVRRAQEEKTVASSPAPAS
ncbi:histone acetyltransferase complex component Epl1 [Xylona heveae TC161]|uniref:Enhancer of polycomb-like protein n=1 Tax=Xylona heveae (strain CBS 132557 / TC161) TaxID=1328760 RepID=A0A165GW12_XYLHT|nr:histone acetyltransferase complex component Epl1 [Xylona heveae TC161]KZF22668.1 histone acetyltransferase complex component Epl1 [Xylona heveae TC161]